MKLTILEISKIDVVKQLIDEAIILFFQRRNAIVIHTIVGAAHQVLNDLTDRQQSMIKNDNAAKYSGKGKDWFKRLNKEYNFFKHADDDKNGKIKFDPLLHTYFLIDCIYMYRALTGTSPYSHNVFDMWFALANPNAVGDSEKRNFSERIAETQFHPEDYEKFLGLIDK